MRVAVERVRQVALGSQSAHRGLILDDEPRLDPIRGQMQQKERSFECDLDGSGVRQPVDGFQQIGRPEVKLRPVPIDEIKVIGDPGQYDEGSDQVVGSKCVEEQTHGVVTVQKRNGSRQGHPGQGSLPASHLGAAQEVICRAGDQHGCQSS